MGTPVELSLLAHLPPNTEDLSVLNLGAGYCSSVISSQFTSIFFRKLVNVEIWPSAYVRLARLQFETVDVENYNDDLVRFINNPDVGEYDVVTLIDALEHIEKDVALGVLRRCSEIAKRTVIFLPIGECRQDDINGNPYQRHLSTWSVDDFAGAVVHFHKEMHKHFDPPVDAAWVIYENSIHTSST